jgi:hypothetical protein
MQRMPARKKEPIEYWPEALGILVIVIYLINYIVGSSKNRAIAGYITTIKLNDDKATINAFHWKDRISGIAQKPGSRCA